MLIKGKEEAALRRDELWNGWVGIDLRNHYPYPTISLSAPSLCHGLDAPTPSGQLTHSPIQPDLEQLQGWRYFP